ncbi:MAG: TolB family protein [Gaiellaceae bacterium]
MRPKRARDGAAVVGVAVLGAATLSALAAQAASGGPADGAIGFVSSRDGNAEIYLMNADGSGQTAVTRTSAHEQSPAWAPTGRHIAFSRRDEILVLHTDGGQVWRLTDDEYCWDSDPTWSPGGAAIAFRRGYERFSSVWVMQSSGRRQREVAGGIAVQPDWAPDGRAIAFTAGHFFADGLEMGRIVRIPPSGGTQTPLSPPASSDLHPTWSPDGARIAFESIRDGNRDIYVMDADGSEITRLTEHPADDSEPAWSPDGTRIAFVSSRDGNAEIYVMNANGRAETRLTTSPEADTSPDWRPPEQPAMSLALPSRPVASPARCQLEQPRRITFSLAGHLRARGKVTSPTSFCPPDVSVRIQRRTGSRWRTIARVEANDFGLYGARLADVPGRYRAVAPRLAVDLAVPVGPRVCLRAVTAGRDHLH